MGEATQCVYAKDRSLMKREFPVSYGLPIVHIVAKNANPKVLVSQGAGGLGLALGLGLGLGLGMQEMVGLVLGCVRGQTQWMMPIVHIVAKNANPKVLVSQGAVGLRVRAAGDGWSGTGLRARTMDDQGRIPADHSHLEL